MARLIFRHIAGQNSFFDDYDLAGSHCDFCATPKGVHIFIKGEECWRIQDGFGRNQCVACRIKELRSEIVDLEWTKENNLSMEAEIERIKNRELRRIGSKQTV